MSVGALAGGRGRVGKRDADGRVGFEGTPQPELLADLTERGQHFLAEEADACLGIRARDEAVGRPESKD